MAPPTPRPGHRVTRYPQPFSDLRLGNPFRSKPSNQRPVFQSNHTPIIECSLFDRQNCSVFSRHRQFLEFPIELRTIVYTTNAIESLNARFRKAVRHRGHFPNEQAALKVLYLVAIERRPNRSNPTGRINSWKSILNALTIHYGDRITAAS